MKIQSHSSQEIRFVKDKHQYFLGDCELPSITKILQKLGLTKSFDGVDPWYAQRGQAVHRAIELESQGRLDVSSIDPALNPFLAAWEKFKKDKNPEMLLCEKIIYSEEVGFAGRIDWVFRMDGDIWLIDGKCTKKHDPGSDYQLCAQAYGLREMGETIERMGILELHEDETYDLCEYEVDFMVWPAVMKLYKRKTNKNG